MVQQSTTPLPPKISSDYALLADNRLWKSSNAPKYSRQPHHLMYTIFHTMFDEACRPIFPPGRNSAILVLVQRQNKLRFARGVAILQISSEAVDTASSHWDPSHWNNDGMEITWLMPWRVGIGAQPGQQATTTTAAFCHVKSAQNWPHAR